MFYVYKYFLQNFITVIFIFFYSLWLQMESLRNLSNISCWSFKNLTAYTCCVLLWSSIKSSNTVEVKIKMNTHKDQYGFSNRFGYKWWHFWPVWIDLWWRIREGIQMAINVQKEYKSQSSGDEVNISLSEVGNMSSLSITEATIPQREAGKSPVDTSSASSNKSAKECTYCWRKKDRPIMGTSLMESSMTHL